MAPGLVSLAPHSFLASVALPAGAARLGVRVEMSEPIAGGVATGGGRDGGGR